MSKVLYKHLVLNLDTQHSCEKTRHGRAYLLYSICWGDGDGSIPWVLLATYSNQVGELQIQRENLSQEIRWRMIEGDTQGRFVTSTFTCAPEQTQCIHAHEHTEIHTHMHKKNMQLKA